MKTGIDWALKAEPWCWIGPAFKADAEAIAQGLAPPWGGRKRVTDDAATELRARRIKAGLSQTALAQRVGCSHSTISHAEGGVGSLSGSMWSRIDAVLVAALTAAEGRGPGRPRQTLCKKGHPIEDGSSGRRCYACMRERAAGYFRDLMADPHRYAARKARINLTRRGRRSKAAHGSAPTTQ